MCDRPRGTHARIDGAAWSTHGRSRDIAPRKQPNGLHVSMQTFLLLAWSGSEVKRARHGHEHVWLGRLGPVAIRGRYQIGFRFFSCSRICSVGWVRFVWDLEEIGVIRSTRAVWRHCEFGRAVKKDALERYTEQQQGEVVMRSGDRGR